MTFKRQLAGCAVVHNGRPIRGLVGRPTLRCRAPSNASCSLLRLRAIGLNLIYDMTQFSSRHIWFDDTGHKSIKPCLSAAIWLSLRMPINRTDCDWFFAQTAHTHTHTNFPFQAFHFNGRFLESVSRVTLCFIRWLDKTIWPIVYQPCGFVQFYDRYKLTPAS